MAIDGQLPIRRAEGPRHGQGLSPRAVGALIEQLVGRQAVTVGVEAHGSWNEMRPDLELLQVVAVVIHLFIYSDFCGILTFNWILGQFLDLLTCAFWETHPVRGCRSVRRILTGRCSNFKSHFKFVTEILKYC